MSLCDARESTAQRDIQREIEIAGEGGVARLNLQVIGAERLVGFRVRPEEALGDSVLASVEVLVPVGRKLIVPVPARHGQGKRPGVGLATGANAGCAGNAGN